ncbi:MAG: glycosyltransferase family 2 protein [Candidatus Thiodiazotropha sp.]
MSVSAITVNYYSEHFLPNLGASLIGQPEITECLLINNGSHTPLSPLEPPFTLIENANNLGFGKAVNRALQHCSQRWILLVNPDVVLQEHCIDHLLGAAQRYDSPIVGPRFYLDEDCRFRLPPALGDNAWLNYAQEIAPQAPIDQNLLGFYWEMRHARFWETTEPFYEPFLSGSCLLIDRERLCADNALFDERYFLYYEDTDLCLRALQQGFRPLCIPDAYAVHYFDQSPDPGPKKIDLMQQAKQAFFNKHYHNSVAPVSAPGATDSEWKTPERENLGCLDTPPAFQIPKLPQHESCYFEISLSPAFVPFAQTIVTERILKIPEPVWNRLRPGHYFARVRGERSGISHQWSWSKPASTS